MARMHSKGTGTSGSSKPYTDSLPEWSETDPKAVEELIISLHEAGNPAAVIGIILRDQHAVPSVRKVCGSRISQILAKNGVELAYPADMMNLMRKALNLIDHVENNRKDLHNQRQLHLTESKIRRLGRYYQGRGVLDSEWAYKRERLRLIVE